LSGGWLRGPVSRACLLERGDVEPVPGQPALRSSRRTGRLNWSAKDSAARVRRNGETLPEAAQVAKQDPTRRRGTPSCRSGPYTHTATLDIGRCRVARERIRLRASQSPWLPRRGACSRFARSPGTVQSERLASPKRALSHASEGPLALSPVTLNGGALVGPEPMPRTADPGRVGRGKGPRSCAGLAPRSGNDGGGCAHRDVRQRP
jgi:hypothetical protein